MPIDVGRRIKALREERGWTQPELAAKVGVATNTINRVENAISDPSVKLLQRLANGFRVPLTCTVSPETGNRRRLDAIDRKPRARPRRTRR